MANTSINCLTSLLEPFGTSDILLTPVHLNIGETMFVQPNIDPTVILQGDEDYVYDFDANNITKDVIPVVTDNSPYAVAFPRKGDRYITLSVYDKVPYIDVLLASAPKITNEPFLAPNIVVKNNGGYIYAIQPNTNSIKAYTTDMIFIGDATLSGSYIDMIATDSFLVVLTTTHIFNFTLDISSSQIFAFTQGKNMSICDKYIALSNNTDDNVYLYDVLTNTMTSTFQTGQGNSACVSNNIDMFYSVNTSTNRIDTFNINTMNYSYINLSRTTPLNIHIYNSKLFIRYFNIIDVYNAINFTFEYSINTSLPDYFQNTILFNSYNDEAILFLNDTNKCNITKFDTNTGVVSDLQLTVNQLFFVPKLNVISNTLTYYYINPLNNTKNVINISATNFNENYKIQTNTAISNIIQVTDNLSYFYGISEYYTILSSSTISNRNIRGRMITSATKNFQVYDFPKNIVCVDVAAYQEVLTISVEDDDLDAENYTWYVNNIIIGYGKSVIYTYGADIKSTVKCVIKNGYITKTLTKNIVLAKKNEANNYRYDSDITPNLVFFNKEGDMINMDYDSTENKWTSELYFDKNSSDTYKTIGLNVMENVAPIHLESDNNLLIKNQVFNEYGYEFNNGGYQLEILDYKVVDKKSNTKKIYVNTSKLKKGYEIEILNLYTGVITQQNQLSSYSLSELNTTTQTCTILDVTKDYILVYSNTNNAVFDETYIHGVYRDLNNTQIIIDKGVIKVNNTIKLKNTSNYNTDWNEPFYINGMYENKPLSIVNPKRVDNNRVVYFHKNMDTKYLKQYICDIPVFGDITFNILNEKVEIGTSMVTIIPATTYYKQNIFVWDKTLTKDYTPGLLKKNIRFGFYETNDIYAVDKIDISSNILKPITNNRDGYQIKLSNNFSFELTINKSVYNINHNNYPSVTLQEVSKQVSIYINSLDKITSYYDDTTNIIYVYPIDNSTVTIVNIDINSIIKPGCLSNKPNKILDNNNIFVDISSQHYGYTHYDYVNESYNIYTQNNEWTIIPKDKKIVLTSSTLSILYSTQEYTGFLDDNTFTITFDESYGLDNISAIGNFINKNTNVFASIGLSISVNYIDNTIIFEQQLLSPVNVDYIIPLLPYTTNNIGVDIVVLTDESILVDEVNNDISLLNTKKIIFDNLIGDELVININGIDYKSNIIVSTAPDLNLEYSLINWGLTMFEDDKNIIENGTYYYDNLESQGVLTWLSKTDNNFNVLNIETRYPNQELNINTNQQVLYHDSDIVFNKIINKLSITISNKIYMVNYNTSIDQTIVDFVNKYKNILSTHNIIIESINNKLSFYTNKDIAIAYTIYAGITDANTYVITHHRKHNMGCVLASNEVRNLTDDLESYKFSTGMILNIENSMFYNNNQEYNILYVDNESLVLSYQGAFWRGDDKLGYIYSRKNFEWISYSNLLNTNTNNTLTGIFTDTNTEIADNYINPTYTIFDPSSNKLVVLHNNGLSQDKATIVDLATNTIFGSVNLGSEPVHGLYNSETQSVFVVNKNSVKITEIKNGILHDEILIGYQANRIIFDYTNNKIYVSLIFENAILMIDMHDYNIQNTIYLSPNAVPSKMVIDETNRTLYVLSSSDNMIYTIDMELYMLSGSFNTGSNPIDIKINSNLDVYTANKNDNTVTYINNNLAYTITLDSSPLSVAMINDKFYVLTNINKIHVIDTYTNTIVDSIDTINVTEIVAVYFTNKLFMYNNVNSVLGYIDLTNNENVITNINYDSVDNNEYTIHLGYTDKAVIATSSDKIHIIEEAPHVVQLQHYSNFVAQSLKISLTTRDFIRYPRERYSDDDYTNISLITSVTSNQNDIFLYNPDNKFLDMIYSREYVLPYLDDISSLSLMPSPLQLFVGFKGVYDTVSNSVLTITRNKHISNVLSSSSILFEPYDNSITIKKFNFIEAGYGINDTIVITNLDGYMENAGLQCKIVEVYINKVVVYPINKEIKYENLDSSKFNIEVLPQIIAEISLLGETVTEDERFRVQTGNLGCDINRDDIYIFKEYDILESGIDWTFMNSKRKEMLLNRNDIYNYIGSYKALVNSVNYFGYNDISLYEYYYNRNDNTYKKLEIPKIFDKSTQYTSTDYVKQLLPNDKYKKTNLFNLTYDITDTDGNYILAYSLDEVITKLIGLKKWLQNNVMPLGMKIKDITGVSTTSFSNQLCASNKAAYKYNITDSLTPMDFDVVAILQPLKNNSKTYSIHINFLNDVSEYFSIKIKTFKEVNSQYRYVQNFSYYKTDNTSINITCDINTDPYIMIETESDNGYGATYNVKKTYSLLSNNFIN